MASRSVPAAPRIHPLACRCPHCPRAPRLHPDIAPLLYGGLCGIAVAAVLAAARFLPPLFN
ncbi:MAG: hypothetical protein ACLGIM_04035 [Alphaproteobacteria bacterium]|jgi:hypothetical protein